MAFVSHSSTRTHQTASCMCAPSSLPLPFRKCCAVSFGSPQVKLDGPVCDYEGLMAAKKKLAREVFDAAGHKSLETQAYKVGC